MQPSSSSSFIQSYLSPICSLGLLTTASSKFSHAPEFPNAKLGIAAFPTFCALFSAYRFYNCNLVTKDVPAFLLFFLFNVSDCVATSLFPLFFHGKVNQRKNVFILRRGNVLPLFYFSFFNFNFIPFLVTTGYDYEWKSNEVCVISKLEGFFRACAAESFLNL